MVRRLLSASLLSSFLVALLAAPAFACGGLVNPNGSVTLVRTTTLAAYHDGVEHYVTSFEFAGGQGDFGSIVPLPDAPTKVIRGGDWTLQRLVQETQPTVRAEALASDSSAGASPAAVLLKTKIDALDIVILKGGGTAVGNWAREHGFLLPPDAPEILDFYAERSPIFMAVRFNASRAANQGLTEGDGTPIHLVIPTDDPWVPLRILGLGAGSVAPVEADVYLLTDRAPAMLPAPVTPAAASLFADVGRRPGLVLERSETASSSLLSDLRSDKGMSWLPSSGMWLSYLRLDTTAGDLDYDLAIDASGAGRPSPVDAGFPQGVAPASPSGTSASALWIAAGLVGALVAVGAWSRRTTGRPAV